MSTRATVEELLGRMVSGSAGEIAAGYNRARGGTSQGRMRWRRRGSEEQRRMQRKGKTSFTSDHDNTE